MARMNWDADRRRRMVAPLSREAAARFMDWIDEARTGQVIPKKRERCNNAKPWQKPKHRKQRWAKSSPPRNQRRAEKREQRQAQKSRWVTLERRPPADIQHLGADLGLALRS